MVSASSLPTGNSPGYSFFGETAAAEIYTIFDTKKLLNRPATVEISKTSGLAGIAYWINQNYSLEGENEIKKNDPLVVQLKAWVDSEYEAGRISMISRKELEEHISALAPGRFTE